MKACVRRLENLPTCGKKGEVRVYAEKKYTEEGVAREALYRYHPFRCKSIHCPYCSWRASKKLFARLKAYYESLPRAEHVVLMTLTLEPAPDPRTAVERAYAVRKRFYDRKVDSERSLDALEAKATAAMEEYLSRIKDLRERERKRTQHRRFFRYFRRRLERMAEARRKSGKGRLSVGQALRSLWKVELVKGENGWTAHWHVVLFGIVSMFAVKALWRECGGGEVIDARYLRTREDVLKVLKYVSKPPVDSGGLSLREKVEVEIAFYRRRSVEVWGFESVPLSRGKYEYVGNVADFVVEVEKENLHDVPSVALELAVRWKEGNESTGPPRAEYCRATLKHLPTGRLFACVLEIDTSGELWLRGLDPEAVELMNRHLVPRDTDHPAGEDEDDLVDPEDMDFLLSGF